MSEAKYIFLPWMRTGIATQIQQTDGVPTPGVTVTRSTVAASIEINGQEANTIETTLNLLGPGDVHSINPKNIIKTEPKQGALKFEPNYFPYVEFYDEYFPWRFSPVKPNSSQPDRLTPWIFLVVLADVEFTESSSGSRGLQSIQVLKSNLPTNGNELWAWAHVQALPKNEIVPGSILPQIENIQNENPDIVISRLLSNRILLPSTNYTAFILPVYEWGRRAGLEISQSNTIDIQTTVWTASPSNENSITFPVYHRWSFTTSTDGDFETLVKELKPRSLVPVHEPQDPGDPPPPYVEEIGKRPIDIEPALELLRNTTAMNSVSGDDFHSLNNLNAEGALAPDEFESAEWPIPGPESLQELINLGEQFRQDGTSGQNPFFDTDFSLDPVVLPPFYGRWHSATSQVQNQPNDWKSQLNLDPQRRLAAALGTKVVQENQEGFMSYAWTQIGDVIEANQRIRQAELMEQLLSKMFSKHLPVSAADPTGVSPSRFISLTSDLQKKVKLATGKTVFKRIQETLLPDATQGYAFRKTMRTRGPLVKGVNTRLGIALPASVAEGVQTTFLPNLNDPGQTDIKPVQEPATVVTTMDAALIESASQVVQTTAPSQGFTLPEDQTNNAYQMLQPAALSLADPPLPPTELDELTNQLNDQLAPAITIPAQTNAVIASSNPDMVASPDILKPVQGYPKFPFPMVNYLKKVSADYIIPNIHLIPDETISLLETNPAFIESFMAGMNHEMGRELLWRDYPTDQRGTYFRNFWNKKDNLALMLGDPSELAEGLADIKPMHEWDGGLGGNGVNTGQANQRIVVIIRGELLRRYPNTVVYAQKAKWTTIGTKTELMEEDDPAAGGSAIMYPKFKAQVNDVYMIGFDLSMDQVKGNNDTNPGWYIILKERGGETRFGIDEATGTNNGGSISDWNNLNYHHFSSAFKYIKMADFSLLNSQPTTDVQWGEDSAQQAHILFQPPVMVAIHGRRLLQTL